jgi:hypothetical protein
LQAYEERCGAFKYSFVQPVLFPYVKFNSDFSRLDIGTVPYGLEGEYLLTLEAELEDYPTVKKATITLRIIVEEGRIPCVVKGLTALP